MDTMKFLLGATAALLFGAIVVSWQGMKDGVQNASPEELAQLRQQIAELQEQQKAEQAPAQPVPPVSEDSDEVKLKLAAALAEVDRLKAEQEAEQEAKQDAKLKIDEEGLIAQKMLEKDDEELKRARWISDAIVMGKVREFIDDPEVGQYITVEVLKPDLVRVGDILGIRRKTGILARFRVSDVSSAGAVADPLTVIGSVKPLAGDELICPPQY